MNKSLLKLMLLPILSLLSCSKEMNGDTPIPSTGEEVEICFTPYVSTDISIQSRGIVTETSLPQDSLVGICGIQAEGTVDWKNWQTTTGFYENLNNARYTVIHTGNPQFLKQDNRVKMPENGASTVHFYAYYPYTESLITADGQAPAIPVHIEPIVENTPDYMVANASANITEAPLNSKTITVPLSFKHALARVDIYAKVEGNQELQAQPVLNTITITTNESQAGQMDVTTGNITTIEGGNTIFTVSPDYPISSIQKGMVAQFMFIPSTNAIKSIVINITNETGTKDYTVYTNQTGTNDISLTQGSISPIVLKYTRTTTMSSDVKGWTDNQDQTFDIKN